MMAHKLFEHRNILYYIYHNQLNIYTDIYVTDLQLVHHWKGQISKPPIQIDQKNFLSESGRLEKTQTKQRLPTLYTCTYIIDAYMYIRPS